MSQLAYLMVMAEVEEVASKGTVEGEADAAILRAYDREKCVLVKALDAETEVDMT
jgi:hypothetical protein